MSLHPGREPADGLHPPRRGWAIAAILSSIVMTVLDTAMVNIALPAIARDLGVAPATSTWLLNAYQLAVVTTLLPFASLGEILGFRRVFLWGMGVFAAAGLACAVAPDFGSLVACRVVQGLASSAVMALTAGLVRYTYPARQLGRAIGLNALSVAISSAAAPSVASAILAVAPWPALFAVNAPIAIAAVVVGMRALPETPRSTRPFDAISATLNVLTFGLFFLGLDLVLHRPGFGALLMLSAGYYGWLLVARQLSQPAPLLPLDLLRIRVVALSVGASICGFAAWATSYVSLPFLLQQAGRSQVETGLMMTPWPVALAFAAPLAGRLSDRISTAWLCAGGMLAFALGLVVLQLVPPTGAVLAFGLAVAICGAGFGFFQTPNNRTMLGAAPKARSGGAGGVQSTARLLGHTSGTTVVALAFQLSATNGPYLGLAAGTVFAVAAAALSLSRQRAG